MKLEHRICMAYMFAVLHNNKTTRNICHEIKAHEMLQQKITNLELHKNTSLKKSTNARTKIARYVVPQNIL